MRLCEATIPDVPSGVGCTGWEYSTGYSRRWASMAARSSSLASAGTVLIQVMVVPETAERLSYTVEREAEATDARTERMTARGTRATLALEDGTVFTGRPLGRAGETTGEVVFNTALCGYQEVLTDPSYAGQIVTMTYPHIGNYGVNREDVESARPQVAGFIVREASHVVSSWRASGSLASYLDAHGIVGISEIDTRALTRHLRTHGAKRGVISALDLDRDSLVTKARASRSMIGLDLAREVTCEKAWAFDPRAEGAGDQLVPVLKREPSGEKHAGEPRFRVVAYDFGMKHNILRNLAAAGCDVTVVPATTSAREALAFKPEGIFLSNGP